MVRITFNNHRNNRDSKNQKSMSLNIDNCKITNYDPDQKTPQGSGDLTLSIVDGEKNYKRGNSLFNNSDVELNEKKYSIFERLAIQYGKSDDLTEEDISFADKNFREGCTLWQLGVRNIDYNPDDGKAVIKITGDEVLYIDFETDKEKLSKDSNSVNKNNEAKSDTTINNSVDKKSVGTKTVHSTNVGYEVEVDYSDVKREWIPYIKKLSKTTGYSQELIISLVLSENFTPVAKYKNEGGGLCEVGFGHTTQAKSNNDFKVGYKIDLKTAFEWLGQDIKDKEEEIKKFGEAYDYDNLPSAMKDAIIDVAFNRGEAKLNPKSKYFDPKYKSVIANIKAGNIGAAAVRLRQENFNNPSVEAGLRKRNVIRFLNTIKGFKPEVIKKSMDLFKRDGYYTMTLAKLSGMEKTYLKNMWDELYNKAKGEAQ